MSEFIAREQTLSTTCPYCGVGCGVSASVQNNEITGVKGDKIHPANFGRLCVKGSALHETLSDQNRLLHPQINGEQVNWDDAIDHVAQGFRAAIEQYGPDSVAFYLSGQLLTEDYYIANKLMKGFIGTSNIDTNSRLCMASAVVAHKRAFGEDAVPACYDDLELAEAIFLIGSNTAYAHPIVFQRIVAAQKQSGTKVVVVDPRRTATCEIADVHIALKPGTDTFFFNGLLVYLNQHNKIDFSYVEQYCDGFDNTLNTALADCGDVDDVARICDVDVALIREAYDIFANHDRVLSLFSQGINQSSSGVDKGNAIINCHLATGKIGREGAAPFSITGQPNAMGGREVGGLANQFAAHMEFTEENIAAVEAFWQAPNIVTGPGLKAVDMFDALDDGKIKAIWVMATNPVVSMPNADKVKRALEKCDLVVVSDCMANTDTALTANVVLPATSWGEKHGTVTNSERRVSLQRGMISAPGEAKHDWQIMCEFAKKMGYLEGFNYQSAAEIFREHAALSGLNNPGLNNPDLNKQGSRAFDISALQHISDDDYESFSPVQWPVKNDGGGSSRLFENGQFYTANRRAQMIPVSGQFPQKLPSEKEFVLNTGRVRDQWHTMTRTGKAPRLLSHVSQPYVQIHPVDAALLKLVEGNLVQVNNNQAQYMGITRVSSDQREGEIFAPMHWNNVYSSFGRIDALVNPVTDPYSGQPEFKQVPVEVKPYPANWHGMLVSADEIVPQAEYWTKTTSNCGFAYQLADQDIPEDWQRWLSDQYTTITDWVTFADSEKQFYRVVGFRDDTFCVGFFASLSQQVLPHSHWLSDRLGETFTGTERFALLAATDGAGVADQGAIICSCFQVGEVAIQEAISLGCDSAEKLGEKLKCGTNCGSCIPELASLISAVK